MLIDTFAAGWLDELVQRSKELPTSRHLYLLIDGAFVPGLHRRLADEDKAILFESLPGCTEETKDVSPFLTQFLPNAKAAVSLLQCCNRWPMVSLIETAESLNALSDRLAAWCVVEADDQRFNLRFPDTRRLPSIFEALKPAQRAQLTGLAARWSYVSRDGRWRDLGIDCSSVGEGAVSVLDQHQFAILVSDSRIDELLALLYNRGNEIYRSPSRSHALLSMALRAADAAALDNVDLYNWCEWFWKQDQLHDESAVAVMLQAFQRKG
jgi:hypothetical protein